MTLFEGQAGVASGRFPYAVVVTLAQWFPWFPCYDGCGGDFEAGRDTLLAWRTP